MDGRPPTLARRALYVYVGVTASIGAYLILLGPEWFPVPAGQPAESWVPAAIVRIVGAVLVVFSSAGLALARALDDQALLRGIHLFSIGHLVLWAVLLMQQEAILGSTMLAKLAVGLAMFLLAGLMYVSEAERSRLGLRADKIGAAVATHSRYDQAIREAASQAERHRLARELHDSIKQQIFAMQTAAATAETRLDEDQSGVREAIALVRSSAREAMTEMEAMLDQLRATPLDNAGLVAALQKQCDALRFRTDAKVSLAVGTLPADNEIEPGVRPMLLRVAQEAMANVARHARAHNVTVTIGSAGRDLDLSISDDGNGFDPISQQPGMGLHNMESRAADVDGRLMVISAPGTGTSVRVLVPPASSKSGDDQVDRWKPWNNHSVLIWGLLLMSSLPGKYAFIGWAAVVGWLGVRKLVPVMSRRQRTL